MAIEMKTENRTFKWIDLKSIKNQIKDFSPVRVAARARENLENSWIKLATNLRATAKTVSAMPANFATNFQENKQQVQVVDANKYVEIDKKIETNINQFNQASANFAINGDPRDLPKVSEQLDIMEKLSKDISELLKKQAKLLKNSPLVNKIASFEGEQEEINNQTVGPVSTSEVTPSPVPTSQVVPTPTIDTQPSIDAIPSFQPSVSPTPSSVSVPVEETPVINDQVTNDFAPTPEETPTVSRTSDVSQSFDNVANIINEARKAVDENKQLKLDLTGMTKERDSLKIENTRLNDVNNINGQAMDKLMDQVDDLKKQNGDQANTIANYAKENNELKGSLENQIVLNEKIANYERIIASHNKEKEEMETELKSLRLSANDSVTRINNLETDLKKLSTDNKKLVSSITILREGLPQVLGNAIQNVLDQAAMPSAEQEVVMTEQPVPDVEQEVNLDGTMAK